MILPNPKNQDNTAVIMGVMLAIALIVGTLIVCLK